MAAKKWEGVCLQCYNQHSGPVSKRDAEKWASSHMRAFGHNTTVLPVEKTDMKKNPASRKLYNALAKDLLREWDSALTAGASQEWRDGFKTVVALVADAFAGDNARFDRERFLHAAYGRRDLSPSQRRTRKNPAMVTFGNPQGMLSRNVVEIKYQHVVDGQYYRHKFARNQVEIRAVPNGNSAILRRVDGKALTKEY